MKKNIPALVCFLFLAFNCKAQDIKGSVKDADGAIISNASVSLMNARDSSLVKLAVTDASGHFQFKNIKDGRYITNVVYVGYAKAWSPLFEVSGSGDVNLAPVVIAKMSGNLKDVMVTAKKPMVEVLADKTVLNVENSINAVGSDALELLRKS